MAALLGSCCSYSQPHLCNSLYPSLSSVFSSLSQRRSERKGRRSVTPIASLLLEDSNHSSSFTRRSLLFVGISAFSLCPLKATAADDSVADVRNVAEVDNAGSKSGEDVQGEPASPIVNLLNGLGVIGLGVLGALYALARQEKIGMESTIESMEAKMSEKEAAMTQMQQSFDRKLLKEQEERSKQLKMAKEDQASLSSELTSANSEITKLQCKMQADRKLTQELISKINETQSSLTQANESKRVLEDMLREKENTNEVLHDRINLLSLEIKDKELNLDSLKSTLTQKECEYSNLSSILNHTKGELAEANSQIKELQEEVVRNKEELKVQTTYVDELNEKMNMVFAERDKCMDRLYDLQEKFDAFRLSSKEKAASVLNDLSKKDFELNQLQEKLDLALNESKVSHMMISDLENERNNLKLLLEKEIDNVKYLKGDLQVTQEALAELRSEDSDVLKQLQQSNKTCEELSSEVSKITSKFSSKEKSLLQSLDEARMSCKTLSDEIDSMKNILHRTKEELNVMSEELKIVTENRDNLKKELSDAYKKAKTSAEDLKAERNVVSSLKTELEALEKQLLMNKEARKNLETDLEEATKSLDEMNKNALLLSKELDAINSRAANLEAEKDMLYNSLMEQRGASQEAREKLEDAQDFITRLGKEREILDKRAKKLEEELASAKGEILRLRRKISAPSAVNENHQPNYSEAVENVAIKSSRRRKKGGSTSDVSD